MASARLVCCSRRTTSSNSSDQVGRNLLHHTLVALEMWVDEPIESHMGYVASLISRQFAETDVSRGFVNGFQFNCLTGLQRPARRHPAGFPTRRRLGDAAIMSGSKSILAKDRGVRDRRRPA